MRRLDSWLELSRPIVLIGSYDGELIWQFSKYLLDAIAEDPDQFRVCPVNSV